MVYYYATLNAEDLCIGVSMLSGTVEESNMILLPESDTDKMWHKFNRDTGAWSMEPMAPIMPFETAKQAKISELWAAYEQSLFDPIPMNGKLFGNTATDQKVIDAADRLVTKGRFPEEGVPWDTLNGEETVVLYAHDIEALKDMQTVMMQQNFQRYKTLEAQAKAAATPEELANITW